MLARPLLALLPALLPLVPAALVLAPTAGCKVKDPPPITAEWRDDFERSTVGSNYYNTAGAEEYTVVDGALRAKGAYNHPLWLRKKLPADAVIEFEVWSNTPDGDIKVEIYGDGESHAKNKGQYTSSGYVLIMGGWSNSKSILARGNEHGKDLVERRAPKVEQGRHYRWKIQRQGGRVDWWVDGEPFLSFDDPDPWRGAGHEYLGFNNWESEVHYDGLVITPL